MMRGRVQAAALVLAAVAWSSCREASSPATTAVMDSSGVAIVTNLPGSIETVEAWSLSAAPVVDIGSGVSPDVALFRVTAVVPLDGGLVAVGTDTPPQALVFQSDGTLAATLGRAGQGPGEFSSVASVVPLADDSLAVWDQSRRRMSVFTGDGRYVRDVDLSALAMADLGSALTLSGASYLLPATSGSLVLFGVGWFSEQLGFKRVEAPTYRITSGGEQLASYGPFPGIESVLSNPGGASFVIFGAQPYAATSGDVLVVGTAEAPEFRLYSSTGVLERIVRWPDHDRTVEGPLLSEWTSWLDSALASRPEWGPAMRDDLDRSQAERFPAYDGLVAAESGEIWVGAYAGEFGIMARFISRGQVPRMPARRWLVFGADGALAASVLTPEGFQPYAVYEGRVWGVFRDELDVESVRAHEVVKR